MPKIKIAHLYYDLMNLYGEHGNLLALTHHLEEHKIRVITHYVSLEDDIDFEKYDLFYIGSGNKDAFELARKHILKFKKDIKKAIKEKKFFLITGNAIDLFGKSFNTLAEEEKETLGLLDYESFEVENRIVGEQLYSKKDLENRIIGFVNRNTVLKYVKEKHLFEVIEGNGFVENSIVEGIQKDNFYGTYLLGPLFIRNPYFTEYIVKKILEYKKLPFKKYEDEAEIKAYHEYNKNMNQEES